MSPFLRCCVPVLVAASLELSAAAPVPPPEPAAATVPPPTRAADDAAELLARSRAQFLAGELAAARVTLERALAPAPENAEARTYLQKVAERERLRGERDRETTGATLLHDVERAWRPAAPDRESPPGNASERPAPLARKLDAIVLPGVNFVGVDLGRVLTTLATLAEENDRTELAPRGVNLVLLDTGATKPVVSIALRELPLRRVLDLVTETAGCQYEVRDDVVVVRPEGAPAPLETAFFPVARATVLRLTAAGLRESAAGAKCEKGAAPPDESAAIRAFLQRAGVGFDAVAGSSVVYDGSALLVTHTARQLARIRQILRRYATVRQVEIEAKFMEVQEGVLEELGVNWTVARTNGRSAQNYTTDNRSLASAFASATNGAAIIVDGQPVASVAAPPFPGVVPLGAAAGPLAQLSGFIGEFDVNAVVRALAQKQGSDLLSAPKVTVLSGSAATITIAQQLRYPRQYAPIQSQVGQTTSSGQSTGSAGVTITAGTPQDFTTENVGVDLQVTPTVEDDGRSITLELHPVVTEFEGFVEYGGPSLAISGGRTVTIPSGFYQPIFSRREVTTRVAIWDGATLVMGGLTREEGRQVNDKVPLLGDLPAVGRLFRSQGEGAAKRSLLIFVTARLVNPGGAPVKLAQAEGAEVR